MTIYAPVELSSLAKEVMVVTHVRQGSSNESMTKKKDHIDQKKKKPLNRSQQLQTHLLPTDYVENINCTNKGRD